MLELMERDDGLKIWTEVGFKSGRQEMSVGDSDWWVLVEKRV